MDTHLFIEIIESIPSVQFLRADFVEGVHIRFYQGAPGKLVIIDTTDEEIANNVIKGHLIKLGLTDLIERLIPPDTVAINVEAYKSLEKQPDSHSN